VSGGDKSKKSVAKRGRTALPAGERKDRLIQTRVADELEGKLREEARKKRVTVSQLIRNVLEDTFDLVDNVVAEAANFGKTVKRDAQRIASSAKGLARTVAPADAAQALETVEAWQEVVLNREARCARCEKALARGETGFIGLSSDPTLRLWICRSCRAKL
jgi:hypothetical protein